jgi:hypothetical protein
MYSGRNMDNLKNSIMALAASAKVQEALYPSFAAVGDELVLEFSECLDDLKVSDLTPKQVASIEALDVFINQHSGAQFSAMYLESSALFDDPNWEEIRSLAKLVAEEMGWSSTEPIKQKHRIVTG